MGYFFGKREIMVRFEAFSELEVKTLILRVEDLNAKIQAILDESRKSNENQEKNPTTVEPVSDSETAEDEIQATACSDQSVPLLSKISVAQRKTELSKIFALIDKDGSLYANISEIC